jgi:hypothetical protein
VTQAISFQYFSGAFSWAFARVGSTPTVDSILFALFEDLGWILTRWGGVYSFESRIDNSVFCDFLMVYDGDGEVGMFVMDWFWVVRCECSWPVTT